MTAQPIEQMIPLLNRSLDGTIAWGTNETINCHQFLHDVARLAAELPEHKYAINLCTQRYPFLVSFAAVMCRQQTNLLPPNQADEEIQSIADEYNDSYCIVNDKLDALAHQQFVVDIDHSLPAGTQPIPSFPYSQQAAIVFTSGSSGQPAAHIKQWGDIMRCATLASERFKLDEEYALLATVPSQHMYGLETSILFPFITPTQIYNGQPFYPEDIRRAAQSAPAPVVLITTPVHLRACIKANLNWNNVHFIISAAAALPRKLATQATECFAAPILEIYGCTEAGSMAIREPLKSSHWVPHPGNSFYVQDKTSYLHSSYLVSDLELADLIKVFGDGSIELLGRNTDIIKIAGKRGHIGDLNNKLTQIEGVQAGVFYQPEDSHAGENQDIVRLTAFVIAPELEHEQIIAELRKKIDPVFMPRPLYKVSALPFTATGKLPKIALANLYKQLRAEHECH